MAKHLDITLFGENVGYQCGGAEKSTFSLLHNMKQVDIHVLYFKNQKHEQDFKRLPYSRASFIQTSKWEPFPYWRYFIYSMKRKEILKKMDNPQLLFAQGIPASIAINAFTGATVYLVTDESALNICRCYERNLFRKAKCWIRYFLQLPFYLYFCLENRKAMKKARVVAAPSKYYAEKIKEKYNRQAEVIYPAIDFNVFKKEKVPPIDQREYIVLLSQHGCKGLRLFKEVSAYFPDEKFLIVGREPPGKKKRNVVYHDYMNNPMDVYKKTKMVLMPSLWEEAFGMAAIEAGLLGIPVLVSNRGGLPETVPKEYVVEDYKNVQAWVKKVKQQLANPEQYIGLARKHAQQFDDKIQSAKLVSLIRQKTGMSIEVFRGAESAVRDLVHTRGDNQ